MLKVLVFVQPGCLSCELIRVYLEANEIVFEERDIIADPAARLAMTEQHGSGETPTLVVDSGDHHEVIIGFDPVRLDQLLDSTSSSGAVTES